MSDLYFSRAQLRRGVRGSQGALIDLVAQNATVPNGRHKLIWNLFPHLERQRPFVFRELDNAGSFLLLSSVEPEDTVGLWELETKPFNPPLREGLKIRFNTRLNPTVCRDKKRHDLVVNARRAGDQRHRNEIAADVCVPWAAVRLANAGIEVDVPELRAFNYRSQDLGRSRGPDRRAALAMVDVEGVGRVTDPEMLRTALRQGVGHGRAFGCGLLLIAPA